MRYACVCVSLSCLAEDKNPPLPPLAIWPDRSLRRCCINANCTAKLSRIQSCFCHHCCIKQLCCLCIGCHHGSRWISQWLGKDWFQLWSSSVLLFAGKVRGHRHFTWSASSGAIQQASMICSHDMVRNIYNLSPAPLLGAEPT